ncbi:hypothetical protein HAP47_0019460 [Bradyrhizobium sp. 41S5]|uniref:hypothetical protein n=1 Tax=Bradyrhizobium sp. 41S5 TaxID=1404443 RepID=UPI00156B668F|nr:hypothetical protein [Bradyrhizobium sp. 41S5]UFX48716.1 hypothetical protein HAP47_0019460 [Bradyrhizobium sp. 41S5]
MPTIDLATAPAGSRTSWILTLRHPGGRRGQGTRDATVALEEARHRAHALQLTYRRVDDVAREALAEILRRIDALAVGDRRHDPATAAATLGGVDLPEIKLSGLCDEFEVAKKTTIAKMSAGQFKKWKNGKKHAIELLITVIGDKANTRLTRDDVLKYTDHWIERVVDGEVLAATANRDLTHITGMLSAVSKRHRLNLDRVFAGARLEGDAPPSIYQFCLFTISNPFACNSSSMPCAKCAHSSGLIQCGLLQSGSSSLG